MMKIFKSIPLKKSVEKVGDFLKFRGREKIKFIIGIILGLAAGGQFFASAENFIDSFLDTSRVANTWNVEVDTANGEVKLAQRSCDNSVWFCDLAWRCAGTAGDGSQLLVRRANEASKQWKIWGNACDTPQCGEDGAQLGDKLTSDSTIDLIGHYPAQQACKDIGGRLPTVDEMQCILTYRSLFGNNFPTSYFHWTSEESSNAANTRCINTYYNRVEECGKTSASNYIRCVRGW